jgi:serine/threonine protein kinase
MVTELKVTGQTTLSDLHAFAQKAGRDAKIRGRVDGEGNVTLYASTKPRNPFDWVARLFGGGRQQRRDIGQRAVETIVMQSSGLSPNTRRALTQDILRDAPRTEGGKELRGSGLREIVKNAKLVMDNTIEFGGKRFERQKELGRGANGICDLFRCPDDGSEVVVKRVRMTMFVKDTDPETGLVAPRDYAQRDKAWDVLRDEIANGHQINQMGDHPNVMKTLGWTEGPMGDPIMIMPVLGKGDGVDVSVLLGQSRDKYSKDEYRSLALTILQDVGAGLQHLHQHGMLHLDMKLENYRMDDKGVLQLTDFGTSRMGLQHDLARFPVDYATNLPPEVARDRQLNGQDPNHTIHVDEKTDSWVLGLAAYRLLVAPDPDRGGNPFYGPHDGITVQRLLEFSDGNLSFLDQVLAWNPNDQALRERIDSLTPGERDLLNGLLHRDPGQRMTLDQAMGHELFEESWVGSKRMHDLLLDTVSQG